MRSAWFRLFVLALALALTAAACGGDDDNGEDTGGDTTEEETAAEVDLTAFCDAVVEAEAQVISVSQGGPTEGIEPALQDVEDTTPEELTEQITTILEGTREALETQDDSVFETDEFTAADEEVDQFVYENCDLEQVDVSMVDYSFEGVPESVPAGTVGFNVTNDGEELHEMILVRLKDPEAQVEELIRLPEKEVQKQIETVGFIFADPGATDAQAFDLDPGEYGYVCFIPVGTTGEQEGDGPPHAFEGMFGQFTVE